MIIKQSSSWTAVVLLILPSFVDGFVLDRQNGPMSSSSWCSQLRLSAPSLTASSRDEDVCCSSKNSTLTFDFDATQRDDALRIKYLQRYLQRMGVTNEEASDLISTNRSLGIDDLQHLYTCHLFTVPFENLDQHTHPADDSDDGKAIEIQRQPTKNLPSLDVEKTLHKICNKNRGGFCFELNICFAWLLRSLGFKVRLALADVSCSQAIPAHVVILVDDLLPESSVLVDVGFGTPGVCDVVLPLVHDKPKFDMHGDSFRFAPCEEDRFNTVLYRTCSDNIAREEEPMYRFHSEDDMPDTAAEFAKGLHRVLNDSPTFNGKRICVISTEGGHCTLGESYVKWVEKGNVVKTIEFQTETEWREALLDYFGVALL